MKAINLIIVTVFVTLFFIQGIFACSCENLPPIYQAYQEADAVFIGKVISSNEPSKNDKSYDGHEIIFNFEVIENFKGAKEKQIKLNRGTMDSICYNRYTIGDTYLVYANAEGFNYLAKKTEKVEGFVYQRSFCNHTNNLKTAQDQIYFIREFLKGMPEPQIYGSVSRSDTDLKTFDWRPSYVEGIKVVLKSDKGDMETATDKNGFYKFNNVPEGEYLLQPVPNEIYKINFPEAEKVTVLPDKTVSSGSDFGYERPFKSFYGKFSLSWDNKVEGRVVDSEGKPFERFVAKLLPLSKANEEIFPDYVKGSPDHHGEKGLFWFYGNTPGKYVLAIEIYAPFKDTTKKRFFYPQIDPVKKINIFDLTATDKIENVEIKTPFTIHYLKGEMFWSDGKVINSNGQIELAKLETEDEKFNTKFDWKGAKDGKFTMQVLEGFDYWVHSAIRINVLENGIKKEVELKSKPQKISVGKSDYTLKVIFEKPKNLLEK